MVAEMVPEKVLQPRAFSLMPLVWSIGSVFGPSFGGFFARPAEQFPDLFGNNAFLKKYPFVLPNIVAAVFFCISMFTATLFLKVRLSVRSSVESRPATTDPRPTRAYLGNLGEQTTLEGLGSAIGRETGQVVESETEEGGPAATVLC